MELHNRLGVHAQQQLAKLLSLFVIVFLVCAMLPFPKVYALGEGTLTLDCDKPDYYVKGDVIHINATGNQTDSVTLSVYWNWKTFDDNVRIYQNTKTLNASWSLPTATQLVGYYRIVVESGTQTITIWRTLISYEDYQAATLPFHYTWKGVNYTLEGRTFTAEPLEDSLSITYPKIPFQYNVNFYYNNMTFLVRLDGNGWAVDQLYMALYGGVKWAINGTLDNPGTFEFQCTHNPLQTWKHRLDRFQSSSFLTFDFSDLRKAAHAFTWNSTTHTLTVEIPSSFTLDPYILEDGYESGDFSAWTGVAGSPSVVDTTAHCGTYSMEVDAANEGSYYTWAGVSTIYMRVYANFSGTPDEYSYFFSCIYFREDANRFATLGIRQQAAGNYYLRADTDWGTFDSASTITWAANEWHCFELKFVSDDVAGEIRAYYDGSELITQTALDTSSVTVCNHVRAAGYQVATGTLYCDCVIVDTSYIGVEGAGETEFTYELTETNNTSADLYLGIERILFGGETPATTEALLLGRENAYTGSETAGASDLYRVLRELAFLPDSTTTVTASLSKALEGGFVIIEISETAVTTASIVFVKEILLGLTEITVTVASSSIGKEVTEILVEIAETVITTAALSFTTETITFTLTDVFGIAALALILALVAFVLVLVKRRQE